MSMLFHDGTGSAPDERLDAAADADGSNRSGRHVDSNAVRWVLAATVAFWLTVYAVGRNFF